MKRETLRHPKTHELASRLHCERPTALGHLTLLWDWTAEFAIAGNIGRWPNGAIAGGCDWRGDADQFVSALIASGWLDEDREHRLVVHHWAQHCENWIRAKCQKLGIQLLGAKAEFPALMNGTQEPDLRADLKSGSFSRDQSEPSVSETETETETEGFAGIQKPDWPDLDSILGTESPLQDSGIEANSVWEPLKTPEKLRDPQAIYRWHRWQLSQQSPALGPERFWQPVLLALGLKLTKSSRVKNPKSVWVSAICKSRFKQARAFVPQAIELLKPIWAAADSQGGQP